MIFQEKWFFPAIENERFYITKQTRLFSQNFDIFFTAWDNPFLSFSIQLTLLTQLHYF